MKRALGRVAYIFFLLALFFGGLKIVDALFLNDPRSERGTIGDRTINTFDLYPWTGGHTQANASTSPLFRTGDHGFFIDFDLDQPPPKAKEEFRLALIGGSAAAGWGAESNDQMMYRVLERLFTAQQPCGPTISLRVINLAMGGSVSYQNYIALNFWAHALAPDMILSFSGVNDTGVPLVRDVSYAYWGFYTVRALTFAAREDASPRYLRLLTKLYPGLIRNTPIGMALRALSIREIAQKARLDYMSNFPPPPTEPQEVVDRIIVPMYVNALQSIKRDFLGVPMFVTYQPYMATDADPHIAAPVTPLTHDAYTVLYEQLIKQSRARLDGYLNKEWRFFDSHQWYRTNMAHKYRPGDGVHLDGQKQAEMSGEIANRLFPWICTTAASRSEGASP